MMNFLFDDAFYNFNRAVKDMHPYYIRKFDDHATIIHNVVGINEKDLTIEIEPDRNTDWVVVRGYTKNEISDSAFSVNSRISFDKDTVMKVDWDIKNGLLYINLYYKKPELPDIKIERKELVENIDK